MYNEELSHEYDYELVETEANGHKFLGVRIYLKSIPEMQLPLHEDDDRSAVTFWVAKADESKLEALFRHIALDLKVD